MGRAESANQSTLGLGTHSALGSLPQWATGPEKTRTDRLWPLRASSGPPQGVDSTLDTPIPHTSARTLLLFPFLCLRPPRHPQTRPGFGAGHTQRPKGPWPLPRASTTLTQPPGARREGEWETPYPSTVISADGYPLVLGHGIGCWHRLGGGSREHRGRGRHGWSSCRGALPILLHWHLQRQGLGPNHLETFLSKSQAQGGVGDVSS